MRSSFRPFVISAAAAATIIVSGCSSTAATSVVAQPSPTVAVAADTAAPPSATATPTIDTAATAVEVSDPEVSDPEVSDLGASGIVERIGHGFTRLGDQWPGFDPNEHPVLLSVKDSAGDLQAVLAINFPNPEKLGAAAEVDAEGTGVGTAHLITGVIEADRFAGLQGFDFHFQVADVDSFAMEAGGVEAFFDPNRNEYVATLLHEMFHRWQDEGFNGGLDGQDVEGYAYTGENLELAALEDRALSVALTAETGEERELAARRFAALRVTRLAADSRVRLDNSQERFEGTARWIEHATAGADTDYATYSQQDFTRELVTDPTKALGGVKDYYGFGRFYSTGAAIIHLLGEFGVTDIDGKIESGLSPAEVLIEHLGMDEASAGALVADARSDYDPLGELPALAEEAAAQAENEGPVFGDQPGFESVEGGEGFDDEEGVEMTDEHIACFADRGIDLFGDDEPSQADFEACLG